MSGTSLDGEIDVALLETDGYSHIRPLDFKPYRYDKKIQNKIRSCFGSFDRNASVDAAEDIVTKIHIDAVNSSGFRADIIGFHGQTITHDPDKSFTWQIGDGERLARETGMDVVCNLRISDIKAGGQGAPLLPLYHAARLSEHETPVAILNIGGVANITFIAPNGDIIAFDTGPGNALMDDFVRIKTGKSFDRNGHLAAKGKVHTPLIKKWLSHLYFSKKPPKSLDRNEWNMVLTKDVSSLSLEDGLATLMAFTVESIVQAQNTFPEAGWYACGGGRHNAALMAKLNTALPSGLKPVEALGWNGDAVEAEGFAYLAVRSLLGLPLTLPSTTGVPEPLSGGVFCPARKSN